MPCPHCGTSSFSKRRGGLRGGLREMSRAATSAAKARLREAGKLPVASDWRGRLASCEDCPLRTLSDGVAHCGRPMWQRDLLSPRREDGCGCPLVDKARDPAQHCPRPADEPAPAAACGCRWCAA